MSEPQQKLAASVNYKMCAQTEQTGSKDELAPLYLSQLKTPGWGVK